MKSQLAGWWCVRAAAMGLGLVVLVSTVTARAAEDEPVIGDTAPAWQDLVGTDDQKYSLNDQKSDVIVLCFTCNGCPYAVDYEDRLIALQKKFKDAGSSVQVIAINSNAVAADELPKMKERAAAKKFNFPYVRDETQEVAKAYAAIYTPEFYVLNKARQIVYRGAMDDSTKAENVKVRYVELAVAAALDGKTPEVTKTGARGCAIRFKRRRRR